MVFNSIQKRNERSQIIKYCINLGIDPLSFSWYFLQIKNKHTKFQNFKNLYKLIWKKTE